MTNLKQTIKDWMLPIAMITGASSYLIYYIMPDPVHCAGPFLNGVMELIQPLLIFAMLFLTFCRIEPKDLKPHRWHWWLLLVQGGMFAILGLTAFALVRFFPGVTSDKIVLIESAMLCMICPTATAAAVVTRKLGGDIPGITTYIVLINILVAVLIPVVVPIVEPVAGADFWTAFSMIMVKVFPLLITPCLCAWLVRYLFPRIHRRLMSFPDLAFYLWAVALTLAIAMTTKSIVHSQTSLSLLLWMAAISMVCCVFNFVIGRYVGSMYKPRKLTRTTVSPEEGKRMRKITAGQSLGQKNIVFAIWLGYTFFAPETAIIGGFYSIWHNIYNSWQLRRERKGL